jgi:hypothetical protein
MKRLFEDPALSSELRAELSRAQRAGREYDVSAKLAQLRAAVESAQPTQTELLEQGAAAGVDPSGGPLASPLIVKLTLSAALLGMAAYLVWPEARPAEPKPEPPPPAAAIQPSEPAPIAAELHAAESPAATAPPAIAAATPLPSVPEEGPVMALKPASRSSRREIAQLVRIRALLDDSPIAAYQLAQRSEQEFPRGVLGEERRALQVEALAKSGRTANAERKAREFFARYPQSPLRERVEAALRR